MTSASITPSGSSSSLPDLGTGGTSFGSPDSLHPDQWTTQQVVRWLGTLAPSNLSKLYSNTFMENDIAGEVLIQLDLDALKDLGFSSVGHRLALLKAIYELKIKWDIEIDGEDWKPSQPQLPPSQHALGYAGGGGMVTSRDTIANVSAVSMLRALQERDERVRALELELARLEDWLVRWTSDPSKTDSLPPYFPPSKIYCTMPDGLTLVDERRSSAHPQNSDRLPPSAFSGPVTAISSAGMEAGTYDDLVARGRKPSANLTPSSSSFNMLHHAGNASQLMELSPTSSNATPSATPTSAQHPLSLAAAGDSPLMHRVVSPNTAMTTSQGNAAVAAAAAAAAAAAVSSSSYTSAHRPTLSSGGGEPSSPLLSMNNSGAVDSVKDRTAASSSSTSADAPYKSFRVTLDDPCHKVLPAALKKYKINDDWRQYALFICYGTTERCLSYDEKPLLLFQKLKEAKQSPVFMLRHIRDVKSPIAIASAKASARKTATAAEAAKTAASSKNSSWNSSASYMSGVKVLGGKGDPNAQGASEERFIDSPPGQPKISGPASQLADPSSSGTGAEAETEDTFAVSIYPYVSEREDEFDVSVGDTFVVKSKAKGWWIVQRDLKASGQADVVGVVRNADGTAKNGGEIQSGWVPAGCLLETKQPLSTIVPPSSLVSHFEQQQQQQKTQSPRTPNEGTFSHQQQQQPQLAAGTDEDAKTPRPATLSSAMANAPIPPSLITSTSTPGLLLMDYNSPEEKIQLPKDTRLRVFKRYNHWSYCVDVGPGHSRAWLPSWYIGKVGTRSNSTNSRSTSSAGAEGKGGGGAVVGGERGESRSVSRGSASTMTAGAPPRSTTGVELI